MLTAQTWRASIAPVSIAELKPLVRATTERAFRAEFGNAFFVSGLDPAATAVSAGERTVSIEIGSLLLKPVRDRQWVHMVCSTGRSAFPEFVSIGRTRNNDVVLNHLSVSRFHASIISEGRGLAVFDAGSSHGSFVDGKKVPIRKQGAPIPLVSCAVVRFGSVELTFFDAAGLVASLQ